MKRIIPYIAMAGMTWTSCYYDVQEELHPSAYKIECDSTAGFTYSLHVSEILSANCTVCHSQSLASAGVVLDNYNGVKIVADNGKLAGAIDHQTGFDPMPLNAAQLSVCDRLIIKKWIENGSTNN
jgi:uncharacterized membrane protein